MTVRIEAAGRTHVGLVRQRNEDRLYVGDRLFAVADGLGGHVAGDVASDTVISTMPSYDRPVAPADLPSTLGRAVQAANTVLRNRISTDPTLEGMGTTLVALLCSETAAVLANVGDSRAYLMRDATTSQITEDHTFEHLVAGAGSLPNLSQRLVRFLDGRPDGRSPDLTPRTLCTGDRLLLCSDGLSSYVPHGLIHEALTAAHEPGAAADRLIELAIEQGGPDNITAIVIDIRDA
jgi:PPM family protein phosphatase